jgi:hypothetical protein
VSSTTYCPGDVVKCKTNFGRLVWANDSDYDSVVCLYIITTCDSGYLTLVPRSAFMANSLILTKFDCRDLKIDDKFIGEEAHYINDNHVMGVHHKYSGLQCCVCDELFPHAEPNRIDDYGQPTLICWSCRTYPHYK